MKKFAVNYQREDDRFFDKHERFLPFPVTVNVDEKKKEEPIDVLVRVVEAKAFIVRVEKYDPPHFGIKILDPFKTEGTDWRVFFTPTK